MIKWLMDLTKRKWEVLILIFLSVIITLSLIFTNGIIVYESQNINSVILNIFGTLFGLLLTAYAILFGLIPSLSLEALESKSLKGVNFRFFTSIIINLLIIIIGLVIYFVNGIVKTLLEYAQLFFVSYLVLLFVLLSIYIFLLFEHSKREQIKRNKK